MRFKISIGPAVLITAAFIGPGTITLCVMAGVEHGFNLLWAMALSIVITIFIQNTAARIAWTTRKGLAKSLLSQTDSSLLKVLLSLLLISAIFIGNAAYEAGNLTGALIGIRGVLSLDAITFGGTQFDWFPYLLGGAVAAMLVVGSFRFLKQSLIFIVLLMSISFLVSAVMTQPNLSFILKGLIRPRFHPDEILTIVGLLGTTVVPYNLFLHAAMVAESPNVPLQEIKKDTFVAIGLGGVISLCIIISAASLEGMPLANAADLGKALEPLYGSAAPLLMSFGFFAAGLTSALTAPIAAAFVVSECLNFSRESWAYKATALVVLSVGVFFTTRGIVPLEIIRFAQIANGILLAVVGLILLSMVNNAKVMRGQTPTHLQNTIFIVIELFFIFLGIKSLGLIF